MEGLERMSLRSIVLHNEPVFFTGTKLFVSCAIFRPIFSLVDIFLFCTLYIMLPYTIHFGRISHLSINTFFSDHHPYAMRFSALYTKDLFVQNKKTNIFGINATLYSV